MNNYVSLTDEQLVSLYEEGDFQAFDILLGRYQGKVYSYIRFMVNDEDLANDFFQDTFVKVIMAIRNGRYTESGQFSSWIMRIARNQVLDRMRIQRNPNRSTISHELLDDSGDLVADLFNDPALCEPNIESKMLVEQSHEDVRLMIKKLPEPQREVIYMRFYRDMSFKEIAQLTGVSINTSLGRMRYALINLRRMASNRDLYLAV